MVLASGIYNIINYQQGTYLDCVGVAAQNRPNSHLDTQKWWILPLDTGSAFTIRNWSTQQCIGTSSNATPSPIGDGLVVSYPSGYRWVLYQGPNNTYYLSANGTPAYVTANGVGLSIQAPNGANTQLWTFKKV